MTAGVTSSGTAVLVTTGAEDCKVAVGGTGVSASVGCARVGRSAVAGILVGCVAIVVKLGSTISVGKTFDGVVGVEGAQLAVTTTKTKIIAIENRFNIVFYLMTPP
jgi:hypothetical protein